MKKMKYSIGVLLLVAFSIVANAATIRVPAEQLTIQEGIDSAIDGDTVLVADGAYTGEGNRDLDFRGKAIRGKAITVTSENGPENCIIDCEGLGRAFYFHSGESQTSVVSGFTITNSSSDAGYIGAICCVESSSPIIEHNTIVGNQGGGIYCNLGSSPSIRNNTISQNLAIFGGAICSFKNGDGQVIYENRIYENRASDSGGGIYISGWSHVEIQKNEIIGNVAVNMGGGICTWDAPTTISDNIIIGNSVQNQGGGIRLHRFTGSISAIVTNNVVARNLAAIGAGIFYQGSHFPVIVDNSIIENIASSEGGGIYILASATTTILNSIIWANSPNGIRFHARTWVDVSYSNTQEIWPGEGNINSDPFFVDAANGDYHLRGDSPCIGTGFEGVDIGAYEYLYEIDATDIPIRRRRITTWGSVKLLTLVALGSLCMIMFVGE